MILLLVFFTRITDGSPLSVVIAHSGSSTAGVTYSLTCSATFHTRNPFLPDPNIPSPTFECQGTLVQMVMLLFPLA